MDYGNFIVLFARQRSGTNAVRSILGTHPEIFCFNEIFALPESVAYHDWLSETNYFNFLAKHADGDFRRILPERHGEIFAAFLEHLRGLTNERFLLIDVKYNSAHHVTQQYAPLAGPPYLFQVLMTLGVRTFVLTRRNYLRYLLSTKKAMKSGVYTVNTEDDPEDAAVAIKPSELLFELERCAWEDEMIEHWFTAYPKDWRRQYVGKHFRWEYADIFANPNGSVDDGFLRGFADWLGVEPEFQQAVGFRKQSHLSLQESIENYDVVAKILRGTRFEECLRDEPLYRAR